jgi:hypothetical protein
VRRVLLSALLTAALAVAVLASSGASAAVSCGGHVTVSGPTSCYKARAIVKEFRKTRKHKIQGFKCSGRASGGRVTKVTCKALGKRIHWRA